jgi:hypothetical protein
MKLVEITGKKIIADFLCADTLSARKNGTKKYNIYRMLGGCA